MGIFVKQDQLGIEFAITCCHRLRRDDQRSRCRWPVKTDNLTGTIARERLDRIFIVDDIDRHTIGAFRLVARIGKQETHRTVEPLELGGEVLQRTRRHIGIDQEALVARLQPFGVRGGGQGDTGQ